MLEFYRGISTLLLFNFEIEHLPGRRVGLVDCITHESNLIVAPNITQYDVQFIVAKS